MKRILLVLSLLLTEPLEASLRAAGGSLTNDVFLAEIRSLARDGKTGDAKEQVHSGLASAGAMEQVIGHLYLANLELVDDFDTNAAVANVTKMLAAADGVPRGTDQVVAAMFLDRAGILMMYAGLYGQAESCLQRSYDLLAKEAGPYSPTTSYVQGRLGIVQFARGHLKSAASHLKDAVTNLQLTHVRMAWPTGYRVYRMSATNALATQGFMSDYANLLRRQEKFRYEGNRLKEYLRFADRSFGKTTAENIPILIRLGYNHESRKYRSSARKYFQAAVDLAEKHRSTHASQYWEALAHAHEYFQRSGQTEERAKIAALMAQDPSPPADPTQAANFLRTHLHASVLERLQEMFRKDSNLRRRLIRDEIVAR